MQGLTDLVARARALTLKSSEITDPTITVTNLGDQGVGLVHGVIYPPEVALVGFGKARERPWAESGRVIATHVVTATLSPTTGPATATAVRFPERSGAAVAGTRELSGRRHADYQNGDRNTDEHKIAPIHFDTLRTIAPDLTPEEMEANEPLRDQVDLDSMDLLNFLVGLHGKLGVDIPSGLREARHAGRSPLLPEGQGRPTR